MTQFSFACTMFVVLLILIAVIVHGSKQNRLGDRRRGRKHTSIHDVR